MPEFSIIVPAYNRQDYLDEALGSVVAQTVEDWECIVVDDASPDVVLTAPDDPRFRLVRNPRNLGIPGSRNVGLSLASGGRICFLDHDDRYTTDRLALARREEPVVVIVKPEDRLLDGDVADRILWGFTPHVGVVTVRKDVCPRFDEDFSTSDDVDWWLRLAQAEPFTTVRGEGYVFRYHAQSSTTGAAVRLADGHLLMRKHSDYFRANRRARAFRWARIAAYEETRRRAAIALLRSFAACPTRYGATVAVVKMVRG